MYGRLYSLKAQACYFEGFRNVSVNLVEEEKKKGKKNHVCPLTKLLLII